MPDSSSRRWFAFRLRTLLILLLLAGGLLTPRALNLQRARRQRQLVEWIVDHGGSVNYGQSDDRQAKRPHWLRWWLGDEGQSPVVVVHLRGAEMHDLSPLTRFQQLRKLSIEGTAVEGVEPLPELVELRDVSISDSPLRDISPLESLDELRSLQLIFVEVTDISPLRRIKKLEELNLDSTRAEDLSPLYDLTGLRKLSLGEPELQELSGLNSITSLAFSGVNDKVTREALDRLARKLPQCEIRAAPYVRKPSR